MPLIKPRTHRIKVVRHICRLQEPNRDALVLYARFIGDTADYVLNQLIDTTIAKDREFVTWRVEQPAAMLADLLGGHDLHGRVDLGEGIFGQRFEVAFLAQIYQSCLIQPRGYGLEPSRRLGVRAGFVLEENRIGNE